MTDEPWFPDSLWTSQSQQFDRLFAKWHEQHVPALRRQLLGMTRNWHAVEDAIQIAFVRLFETLQNGEAVRDVGAWLATVARNQLLDDARRERRDAKMVARLAGGLGASHSSTCSPQEDALVDRAHRERQQAAFNELLATRSPIEQQCVALRKQGLNLEKIGREVGINPRRVGEILERLGEQARRNMHD